jgi:chromosome segregation ATPase
MDEPKVRPGFPGDRSQAAAEKLRALRERANRALDDHRRRLGDIETQLSDRVRGLAEEFGATLGPASPPVAAGPNESEAATLRRQLEDERAKHSKFAEQLQLARQQLDALQAHPCSTCQHIAEQLAAAESENVSLHEQIALAMQRHEEDRARHEKFVEQLAAARQAITLLQHSAGESSAELRAELETARHAKTAAEEQLAAAMRDMEVLHAECDAMRVSAESLEQQLSVAVAESASIHEQAAAEEKAQLQSQVAALDNELQQARSTEDRLQQQTEMLSAQLAGIQSNSSTELQALAEQLAAVEAEGQQLRHELATAEGEKLKLTLAMSEAESAVHELQRGVAAAEKRAAAAESRASEGAEAPELRRKLEQANAAAEERAQLTGELKRTLDEARRELDDLRAQMVPRADFDALQRNYENSQTAVAELQQAAATQWTEVAQLQAASAEAQTSTTQAQAAAAEAQAELARLQSELTQAQTAAAQAESTAAQAQVAAAEWQTAVANAQAETAAVRSAMRSEDEFALLQQKFDLALADVQKLKRENGNLREELAARPESSDVESPELIAVRSERDALAARVADLEQSAGATTVDADAQQERDDLQRRFEMAVDDVRQLKQENAQLRDKLASGGGSGSQAAAGDGGTDWASQRARLMAMLEEEEGGSEVTAERTAERATVEKTIAATDRVVANKDKEIAELRAELGTRGTVSDAEAAAAALRDEVLDADEMIAAERERLAALTAEWEAKLRAAELEFSIERANLARAQAALREQTFELNSKQPQSTAGDVADLADAANLAALALRPRPARRRGRAKEKEVSVRQSHVIPRASRRRPGR